MNVLSWVPESALNCEVDRVDMLTSLNAGICALVRPTNAAGSSAATCAVVKLLICLVVSVAISADV